MKENLERIFKLNKGRQNTGKVRSGVAIFVVIMILLILAVFLFSLASSSSNLRHVTVGFLETEVAQRMANSAKSIFMEYLDEVMRKRSGCSVLYPASGFDSPLNPFSGKALDGFVLTVQDMDKRAEILQNLENLARECSTHGPTVEGFEVKATFRENPRSAIPGRLHGAKRRQR